MAQIQTKREPKPKISAEAQKRIRAFVADLILLQEKHGIEMYCEVDMFGLTDSRRLQPFICDGQVYGDYDAFLVDGMGGISAENLKIEDFEGWGK
jgi:hypothetical protein